MNAQATDDKQRQVLTLTWIWIQLHPWVTVTTTILLNLAWTKYRPGLRHLPGPFIAGVSNLWKLRAVWNQNMPRENVRVHEDYGPIVRIGPNHVSVADPQSMRIIYGVQRVFPKVISQITAPPKTKRCGR
jgi:hypothetical protein